MLRIIILTTIILIQGTISNAQNEPSKMPKLVVGIIVDQMRFDYLYRYQEKYSEGGFKKIMKEGFNYKNMNYNYTPTVTAAGHTSIYTGTTPSVHGIIGNGWYDRYNDKSVENVEDKSEKIIGSLEPNEEGRSPRNILTTTITDQLQMGTNFRSKVISVSLKDRGAILPGGQTANGAYWHDWQTSPGHFVSSSYYMDELPDWVTQFNKLGKSDDYLNKTWNTFFPIETYVESSEDNNKYERVLQGKETPTFPYDFKELRKTYRESKAEYKLLWGSPWGNTLLTEFAMEAIENEALGEDNIPDLLNISYSVPDAAGHAFGPQAIEIEDIYIRLDRELENLLNFLDKNVGKDEYLLFLTSDHAVMPVISYLDKHRLPSGVAQIDQYKDSLTNHLNSIYGENDWVQKFSGPQLYLNQPLISSKKIQLNKIQLDAANYLLTLDGVKAAQTGHHLQINEYTKGIKNLVQNGYYRKRSGDVSITFDSGWLKMKRPSDITEIKGSQHGSGYAYDTHVPMLWYGSIIPQGESVRKVEITDISTSLAMFLNLQLPSGATGKPLRELFGTK